MIGIVIVTHAELGMQLLRTAQERRSILELARLVGYELRPGVASSVVSCEVTSNMQPICCGS